MTVALVMIVVVACQAGLLRIIWLLSADRDHWRARAEAAERTVKRMST